MSSIRNRWFSTGFYYWVYGPGNVTMFHYSFFKYVHQAFNGMSPKEFIAQNNVLKKSRILLQNVLECSLISSRAVRMSAAGRGSHDVVPWCLRCFFRATFCRRVRRSHSLSPETPPGIFSRGCPPPLPPPTPPSPPPCASSLSVQ